MAKLLPQRLRLLLPLERLLLPPEKLAPSLLSRPLRLRPRKLHPLSGRRRSPPLGRTNRRSKLR